MTNVYMNLTTEQKMSLYIPRIKVEYTELDVINTFRLLYIGDVVRVDFVELDGSYQRNPNVTYKSAFVHVECYYYTKLADGILNTLLNERSNKCFKLQITSTEYWLLKPNLNPVKYTDLNIHQLVENFCMLEKKVNLLEEAFNATSYKFSEL